MTLINKKFIIHKKDYPGPKKNTFPQKIQASFSYFTGSTMEWIPISNHTIEFFRSEYDNIKNRVTCHCGKSQNAKMAIACFTNPFWRHSSYTSELLNPNISIILWSELQEILLKKRMYLVWIDLLSQGRPGGRVSLFLLISKNYILSSLTTTLPEGSIWTISSLSTAILALTRL
jgi:hypothetical protein